MKKIINWVIVAITVTIIATGMLIMPAAADDGVSVSITWSYDSSTQTLTISGNGPMDNYASEYQMPWVNYKGKIKNVIINEGITSIGKHAFENCGELCNVTLPSGMTSIERFAFSGCGNLGSVTIPSGVSIKGYAFNCCSGLSSLTLQSGVMEIQGCAFSGCTSLKSITIPASVTCVGASAFKNCTTLEYITVDSGNVVYDSRDNCNAIIETATNTLTVGCKNTVIPSSVTSIGASAFSGTGLKNVTISENVNVIGHHAFENCTNLISVIIEDGVTNIGGHAFYGCKNLSSMTIPSSVTNIGGYAFYGCASLTSLVIPDKVKRIESRTFQNCSKLTSLTIGSGVTSIDEYAFYNCTRLKSVVIPDNVTSIGDDAFLSAQNLTSLTIGNGVTSIGDNAFFYCWKLKSVTIGTGLTHVGYGAFGGCKSLKDVYYGSSLSARYKIDFIYDNIIQNATWHYTPCGHTKTHFNAVSPTCMSTGNVEHWKCDECNRYFTNEECTAEIPYSMTIMAKTHSKEYNAAVSPTCTETGNTRYWYCTTCHKYFSDSDCTEEIALEQTVVSAEGHTEEHHEAEAPTCTEAGSMECWYCTTCNKYFSDEACTEEITLEQTVIPAVGHTEEHHEAVAPTCTEAGSIECWYCTTCNKYFSDEACIEEVTLEQTVVPVKGHTEEHHEAVAPICTEAGSIECWYCTTCNKYFSDEACTEEITLEQTVIPTEGHMKEHHEAEAPTCTEAGSMEYWYCTTCDKYFSDEACTTEIIKDQIVITAKGHSLVLHPRVEPTYTAPGNSKYWTCSECGKHFGDSTCRIEITLEQVLIQKKEVPSIEGRFSDVNREDWFYDSVALVNATGIMKGTGKHTFAPGEPLSRAQLAVMLYRLDNSPDIGYANIFPDVPDDKWYSLSIVWAYNNNIITGYQNGNFGTADNITREQLAVMLYRYANTYKELDVSEKSDISGFSDVENVSSWAREAVEWAVGNKIITGKDNGTRIDPQGNAVRCESAAMFQRFMEKYGL